MVKASIRLIIILFPLLMTFYGQDSAKATRDWIRLASTAKDFSLMVPSTGYLADTEDETSRVWYFEKGVSLIVTMEKRGDAKSLLKRWAVDKRLEPELEKYKYFESGDFLIRQYTYADDPEEDRLFLYLASSEGLYFVSASARTISHSVFERFVNSILLNGKPLFKRSGPSAEIQLSR